ncbi:MAG: BamA/TamA family outer membrane protein, partial [Pseudomonadota bacterium]
LNPTEGARFRAEVTPFIGAFDSEFAGFLTLDTTGSAYFDLTDEGDYVLAGRARLGTILSDDLDTVPQTRRLYSGGGGSVRGYAQRFIGPLDVNDDPTGGRSVIELGGELRARLFGDLGGVIFVEAGQVDEEIFPAFSDGIQVAAGLGIRYFSPAGPIRVDVGFPVNGRDADDFFQLYISIGQAF